MKNSEIAIHNSDSWDREVARGNPATVPVSRDLINKVASGKSGISFTGNREIPAKWIEGIKGKNVLCLACGGGQQVPLLAAAGGIVYSLDNSQAQIQLDLETCRKSGLEINAEVGDMCDLSHIASNSFDYIFIGMGLQFVPDVMPIYNAISRIIKTGGRVVVTTINPVAYSLDWKGYEEGKLTIKHKLPYSDVTSITEEERLELFAENDPYEFSHTYETLIGGLTTLGILIDGFIEDYAEDEESSKFFPPYFVFTGQMRI
jgi:ubiquinone/menaquinone biosynthesis C-methylase UbiE